MEDEKIDLPLLNRDHNVTAPLTMPSCYAVFQEVWEASAKEYSQRAAEEVASESALDGTMTDLPPSISDALQDAVSKVENE